MQKHLLLTILILTTSFSNAQDNELKSQFKKHITTLAADELQGRVPQTKGDTLAVQYIISELKTIEGLELMGNEGLQEFTFESTRKRTLYTPKGKNKFTEKQILPGSLSTFNTVARIDAPDDNNPNNEAIIIGAHYDHMGYQKNKKGDIVLVRGADDNASGVAFVIEYAREIAKIKQQLKRDVIFICFGAEEIGLQGSQYYAKNPIDTTSKIITMINFDMTGRMVKKGITMRGLSSCTEAPAIFSTLANTAELDLIWEFRAKGPTDYRSFYEQGIPSFSFSTRIHRDFHTEHDTVSKINYEGMEMLFRYAQNAIYRFALERTTLTYKESNS